ncbi:hypothetical protein HAX54_047020 [Datura stramonium]|uniref:Uncharacterized protein n=1 Tax=Datura stramonium TaxID=4076 RepID=A0ABS8SSE9_DATST|nr:hypothetical protein [Datura stramonium]
MSNIDPPSLPSNECHRIAYILFGMARMEENYISSRRSGTSMEKLNLRAKGVITLDTKTDKVAPSLKRPKAKDIPSMIQQAIMKAMQLARDNFKGHCATFEVLESDVISLRKDVTILMGPLPASKLNPPEPAAVTS